MAATGILEVVVHLDRFRNVDLYYQGLYYLKLTCSLGKASVQPYLIHHGSAQPTGTHPHRLIEPRLIDKQGGFASRTFFLRYSEEVVELNETGLFRTEIEVAPGELNDSIELQAELYFTDLEGSITLAKAYECLTSDLQFKLVSTAALRIATPCLGVNQFVPIVFDDLYSSVFYSTVHCMLVSYKFTLGREPILDIEQVQELLFPQAPAELEPKQIEAAYHCYVMLLALMHNKVRRLLSRILRTAGVCNRQEQLPSSIKLPITVDLLTKMHHSTGTALKKCPLTTCVKSRNKRELSKFIYEELKEVASRVYEILHVLCSVLTEHSALAIQVMESDYVQTMRSRWEDNFITSLKPGPVTSLSNEPKTRCDLARNKRNAALLGEPIEVEDQRLLPRPELHPIVFEEGFVQARRSEWSAAWFSTGNLPVTRLKVHLFVLVHGLMGTAYDLKYVRDVIALHFPHSVILSSKANEKQTEDCIEQLGKRLAEEVARFIEATVFSENLTKVSFIGHSLGGLIIRASLPHLSQYADKMNLLMTMSTPHLGCVNGKSKLVEAGMWVITRLKKFQSLKQLAMTDHSDLRKTTLYTLAKTEGLDWFKHVVLVGSSQDKYVSLASARIEANAGVQLEMAQALLARLQSAQVYRLNVEFGENKTSLGTLIGRKAHIHLLDNKSLLTMLVYHYADVFL